MSGGLYIYFFNFKNFGLIYLPPTVFSIGSLVRFCYRLQDYEVLLEMGEYCAHAACAMDAG